MNAPDPAYPPPERLRFPDDEARQAWLTPLLDGYHITDLGVHEGIRREQAQGRRLACSKGCAACCRAHLTIPVYPLELIGIYWYAIERVTGATRDRLHRQLADYRIGSPCPFLVDDACSIHPMRPMACRQFNVFDRVCAEGEDAYHTRRKDVLTPLRRYADDAFFAMLPFYGVTQKGERRRAIKQGMQHRLARVLQEQDWSKLAERMAAFDRTGSAEVKGPEA
jgi:Fe-S-cluster containining protein